jgi:beta-N-acetylhexosaminidase
MGVSSQNIRRCGHHEIRRRDFLTAALLIPAFSGMGRARASQNLSTIDRQIGEMIIVGFHGDKPEAPGATAVAEWLRAGLIGGVIFFEDNLPNPSAAKALTKFFTAASGSSTPLLCVDQEGGAVSRLRSESGFSTLPSAAEIAAEPLDQAFAAYDQTASELRRLGFNVNFGPVVDLAANQDSRIIVGLGRSFGDDPRKVVDYAKAFIEAHRRNHVLTALKHFPGHGSAATDPHNDLPDITTTWSKAELRPFVELTNTGFADMVMMGHLMHAGLTEPGRPASLSSRAVTGLLRETLGYNGVVVSDDMQMGAVRNHFSPDDAIRLGVDAGVDLFIYSNREHPDPRMPTRFHDVVKSALESGRVASARIEESAARVRNLKRSIEFALAEFAIRPR